MADVSLMGMLREERTRGQLILITGLLLAVLFVGLALVLNSAIYVENVSTRDAGDESRDVLEQRSMVTENLQSAIDNTNDVTNTSGSYATVEDPFTRAATNWSSSIARENAKTGRIASVRVNSTTEGAELNQSDPTRNFTAGGVNAGNANWTLAENVTDAGTFRLELQNQSLLDMTGGSVNQILDDADQVLLGGVLFHETFHVEVETASGVWRVYMFQAPNIGDEDELYVYTEEPGEDILTIDQTVSSLIGNSCSGDIEGGTATVDIRNGTVGGSSCSNLSYYEDEIVGTEHNISYRNARTDGQLSTAAAQEIVDNYDDSGRLSELDDGIDDLLSLLGLGGVFSDLEDDIVGIWDNVGLAGDRASGSYEVVVDSRGERQNFNSVGNADPTAQTVVYSADIVTTQRSGSVSLTTETEVRWSEAEP